MVQWLAHLTCNPGNAGSIPTHGISVFHSKWISQYFVLARDYIVGFPVLHSKYIYIYIYILKKTTTLLNLQNMFRQKLLSSSVDRFTKR